MKRIVTIAALVAAGMLAAAPATANDGDVLSESNVWRSHVTWLKPVFDAGGSITPAHGRMLRRITMEETAPPPAGWNKPDFDDSSWAYWRQPHQTETLKTGPTRSRKTTWIANGTDTGLPLYEPGAYGCARSPYIGMRSMRGRFNIDDPSAVSGLKLTMEYRGGVVVYLNGAELARAHLPQGALEPSTPAEPYGKEAFRPVKKVFNEIMDPEVIQAFNTRIRKLEVDVPSAKLTKGVNVVALEIHRTPCNPPGTEDADLSWNGCGLVTFSLTGSAGVTPAQERPAGFRVWNADTATRISPFGFIFTTRIGQGGDFIFERYPLSWGDPYAPIAPVNLVAPRNGVCTGQVGVSCDTAIKGLAAKPGDLAQQKGSGRIPASAVEVRYMTFPDEPYAGTTEPSISFADALYEAPPAEVPVRAPGNTKFWGEISTEKSRRAGLTTHVDTGAAAAVWVRVRVPADAPAGTYRGTLTVSAGGHEPVEVPLRLRVAGWTIPDPGRWRSHVGTPHSIDTLAIWYKTPLWSEKHWKMIETTLKYMGELGSNDVYLLLRCNTMWFNNEQSMVHFTGSNGNLKRDYTVLDRYLELVHTYMNPDLYCLYAVDLLKQAPPMSYSTGAPGSGSVKAVPGPKDEPTPEAVAFWKPLVEEVTGRLVKYGAKKEDIMLGLAWEAAGGDPECGKPRVALFKQVRQDFNLVHYSHYGGARHKAKGCDMPFGYAMSVYGNQSGVKTKGYGAPNIPIRIVQYYRAHPVIDLRPTAHPGTLRVSMEEALKTTQGMGPLGMDYWYLPADQSKGRRYAGTLEGGPANLTMKIMGMAALLAPGPDGPISTARFEALREGIQEAEARWVIEEALEKGSGLNGALAQRCRNVLKERDNVFEVVKVGGRLHNDGWKWYAGSGWEDRAWELFECAGEVSKKR